MLEFLDTRKVTARKEHECECCGKTIVKGEIYERETGKFDGEFFTRAWCVDCDRIITWWCANCADDEYLDYAGVWDDLGSEFCDDCEHGENDKDNCTEESVWHCPIIQQRLKLSEEGEE